MHSELEKILVEKYPQLFAGVNQPLTESLMSFGCECGDGWFTLIDSACALIAARVAQQKDQSELAPFQWVQIKEKFGTLRLYGNYSDDYIDGVIDTAERLSGQVCEACGARGKLRGEGWLTTRCDSCAA